MCGTKSIEPKFFAVHTENVKAEKEGRGTATQRNVCRPLDCLQYVIAEETKSIK